MSETAKTPGLLERIRARAEATWEYCSHGVWGDTRPLWRVNALKTLNIVVKSFFDSDIQSRACALTYRTMLAVVPALAMLFAIGRGFGFTNLLQDELLHMFPHQREMITRSLQFVDSYLSQASEGVFVGVGIVFLLWTLISLLSSVEDTFNLIWNVHQGRSLVRQATDYTAMFLVLPVLMICASGMSILVSSTVRSMANLPFLTPVVTALFECASWVMTWLFFTAVFMLVPNTKVKFKSALVAGVLTGTAFMVLQWLFMTGQIYVSKYNAIYGSFSFLPLFLLWMQLVWVICLGGCLIAYASQNLFNYSYADQIRDMAVRYREKVTIAVAAVVVQRFERGLRPITEQELSVLYSLPARLATDTLGSLAQAGVVSRVVIDPKRSIIGYQPALPTDTLTLGVLREKFGALGTRDFVPDFEENFPGVISVTSEISKMVARAADAVLLRDIAIRVPGPTPEKKGGKKRK